MFTGKKDTNWKIECILDWELNRETLYGEANNSTGRQKVRHPGQAQHSGTHVH